MPSPGWFSRTCGPFPGGLKEMGYDAGGGVRRAHISPAEFSQYCL